MDNPASILILLIPAYVLTSLLTAVIGASAAPRFALPRGRFILGLAFSLLALPAALVVHALALAALSYIPGFDRPLTPRMETIIMISLVITLLAGLIAAYYSAFRWRRATPPREQA